MCCSMYFYDKKEKEWWMAELQNWHTKSFMCISEQAFGGYRNVELEFLGFILI